jgi:hypothetical protein
MFHGVLQGRTCIESLDSYPANLELHMFRFRGDRLVGQKAMKLASVRRVDF